MKAIGLAFVSAGLLLPGMARAGPVEFAFDAPQATVVETKLWHHDDDDSSAASALIGRAPFCWPLGCGIPWVLPQTASSSLMLLDNYASNKFAIAAQASADGSGGLWWTDDGAVDFDFTWTVPYTYSRKVTIDQSGPIATATFPVVNRAFEVKVVRNIWAEETWVASYTYTRAATGPVKAGGTELATTTVLGPASVGPKAHGNDRLYRDWNTVTLRRSPWAAPAVGESFGLTLDPSTQTFTQLLQDATDPVFKVSASLNAQSWGSSQQDGPFGGLYGGGEAIACFGANSPMGSFSSDCWDDSGIFVTGLFQAVAYETVLVESLGGDQWRVFELQPIPEPSTVALMVLGLVGVGVAKSRRRCG